MKKFLLVLFLFIAFNLSVFAEEMDIKSNKQYLNLPNNKIIFEGDVTVTLGGLTVKSPFAEAIIDEISSKLSEARFLNNAYAVQIKQNKKNEIKANILKVSLLKKVIYAEGNAQITMSENQKPVATINADYQEYDMNTSLMKAKGGVIIYYKGSESYSDEAIINVNKEGDLKGIELIGNAVIKEKQNVIKANKVVYSKDTQNIIATGNVHTDVKTEDGEQIQVWSEYQQYNNDTAVILASNNVTIKFQDYVAKGPRATCLPDKTTKKPNEVIFTGRAKIVEGPREIEADRIKIVIEPKNFYAEGRVESKIKNINSVDL